MHFDDPISVAIAENEALVRSGLAMILAAEPDIEVVGEAADGAEVVELVRTQHVDVVLMDLHMPDGMDGITATRQLTADAPPSDPDRVTKVLVLTGFDNDQAVFAALKNGASGYLLKHAAPGELAAAVRKVAAGDVWLDSAIAGKLLGPLRSAPDETEGPDAAQRLAMLTPREREVLKLMARGLSNSEIAQRIVVAKTTAKTHVQRVIFKTESGNRTNAVILAYDSGLVSPKTTSE